MKKISLIIYLILLFSYNALSQTTFNKEIKVMDFITEPGPLLIYGDTIICLGHGTDTTTFSKYSLFISKFDLESNFIKRYIDTLGDYYFSFINDAFIVDQNIILAVDSYEYGEFWGSYIMVINIATGKVLKKIKITNPKDQYDYAYIGGLTMIDSTTFVAVSSIREENKPNGKIFYNMLISVVNIESEEVKYIELGKEGVIDIPYFIVWNGDKFLIGTGILDPPYDISNPKKKSISQGLIYEVDISGEWHEVFVSDTMRGNSKNLLINEDGDYICSSRYISLWNKPNTEDYIWHAHPIVFKLDKDFNLLWEKPWGLDFDYNWDASSSQILITEEQDGYILAGYQPNYPWTKDIGYWNLEQDVLDSLKSSGQPPMTIGILQKISEEGDSVWMRSFSVFSDTSFNFIDHQVHDMTYAPDGGYILYGTVGYPPRPGLDTVSNFHGWLLKVDIDGCLIPGCADTIDTTNLVNLIEDVHVMIYPNPTSDDLFVFQRESGHTKYTISDISGAKIMEWSGDMPNHTYIINVSKYKSGVYILNVKNKKGINKGKKFVVE